MAFNISEFLERFMRYGIAKPCSYEISLYSPFEADHKSISVMAKSVPLPGRSFATTPTTVFNTPWKTPYQDIYDTLNIEFYCSSDMYEKRLFDEWQKYVSDVRSHYFEYYDNYTRDLFIYKITGNNGNIRTDVGYVLIDAYPVSIPQVQMGYDLTNQIMTFTVTFEYKFMIKIEDYYRDGGNAEIPSRHTVQSGVSQLEPKPVPIGAVPQNVLG